MDDIAATPKVLIQPSPQLTTVPASTRLQSLDALRGLTIALMILVNTSGDGSHTYRLLLHSPWNGLTFADVVFPCFLFMMGISLVLSLSGRKRRGLSNGLLARTAFRRALVLFAIGLALNGFPFYDLHTLRIFGVLQRIAICSFCGAVIFLWLRPRTIAILTVSILLGYWILLRWVPVPGFGTPGVDLPLLDPHGNWPAWVDRHLLPANHLYHRGYYDPEGLLSSVAALASTLLGVLTGLALLRPGAPVARAKALLIAGVVCLSTGVVWSFWLPLNKRLWTSSFVAVNGGLSLMALALCLWWLDVSGKGRRIAYPLLVFGTNSLAAYTLSEFLAAFLSSVHVAGSTETLQQWLFHPLAIVVPNLYVAALAYAILYVAICFVPIQWMYRRKIFLKV
ncbi:Predicted acyltransferase [Bryocella elongata]|uniref:Predicted acyltransferase n=1 Tax=Bryocella elongata TaxID=863522 RepID=A0A1H5ZKZ1_9BACT|nr:heparan-alpha-glucosaminide N-acetyltransferase domain-containing protein [Bryocella elongata]SEG37188.1 Predicted acyltransferase [Bryocella elongata]